MIQCENLFKNFRIYHKHAGFKGTLKSFVSREYKVNTAVEDFSMEIKQGEFVGLLGPNGAGKTTLMKMLTGIIVPSSGHVDVLGYRPFDRKINFRKKIALVMGQKSQLWWDIPALDSFLLIQRYYEIDQQKFKARLDELAQVLGVESQLDIHVRKLSLGERMKMELIACLLHEPEVIFLDEPTIGLDVVAQTKIRQFLFDYQKTNNTTVILTSHYMADVEALCGRIVLILGGKKRFDGSLTNFQTLLGSEKFVTMRFDKLVDQKDERLKSFDANWSKDGLGVDVRIPQEIFRDVSIQLMQNYPIIDFRTEKLPIERVMETLIKNPELMDCE